MKKTLTALTAFSLLTTISLQSRELLCEQCVPEPDCWEHLFAERSQFFIHGEFLYWTVAEGALDYAVSMNKSTSANRTFAIGKYKTADYDFCPGFRVAASYYNCAKYWEIAGQYTWLKDRGKNSASKPEEAGLSLNPTRITGLVRPYVKASSDIELGYQLGDLTAARVFDPNPHLRMRVYSGITLGWLKQEWHIDYQNQENSLSKILEEWRFFGGGLRLGVTADWFWGCQFYFTARASFATLYGSYKNIENQSIDDEILACAIYDDNRFAMHTQFILGPSWQVPCDCWSFELFAGYESNIWFNVHERIRTRFGAQDAVKRTLYANGLLGIHGLTIRASFGF